MVKAFGLSSECREGRDGVLPNKGQSSLQWIKPLSGLNPLSLDGSLERNANLRGRVKGGMGRCVSLGCMM